MKSKYLKHIAIFSLAIIGLLIFGYIIALIAPVGVIAAELVGTVVTEGGVTHQAVVEAEPGLHLADISKKVYEILPAQTPLDTILRNIRDAEKIDSVEKKYYSVSSKPTYDELDAAVSGNGLTVGAPAKEYTYASGDGVATFYIKTDNPALWSQDDTFLMRDVVIAATGIVADISGLSGAQLTTANIVFYVEEVSSDVLRIKPINGILGSGTNAANYVMPDFTSDTKLYIMGNAKNEKATQTQPFGIIPTPDTNYIQLMMVQIEQSTWEKIQKKEVDWNFADLERQNIYAMKQQMEMSYWWGAKSKVYNAVLKDYHYTCDGTTRKITKSSTYGTGSTDRTFAVDDFLNLMAAAFVGNNGSQERWLIGGSTVIKAIEKLLLSETTKQLGAREVETKYGMKVNVLTNFFGTLNIMHAPLFSINGAADIAYVIDPEHIHKHSFVPMQANTLDLKTSGQRNVDARVIMEASCPTVTFGDVHLLLKPKA